MRGGCSGGVEIVFVEIESYAIAKRGVRTLREVTRWGLFLMRGGPKLMIQIGLHYTIISSFGGDVTLI